MTDINLQLTREFFELNGFRVMTPWHRAQSKSETGACLYVDRPGATADGELPFLLAPSAIERIDRAIVEVRAWHSERVYASTIDANAVLYEFAQDAPRASAADYFATEDFHTILVISELPATDKARLDAMAAAQRHGIDHILEFQTILRDLIDRIDTGTEYTGSVTLQLLRLLKRYRLVRNSQLEFAFPLDPPILPSERLVETAEPDSEEEELF